MDGFEVCRRLKESEATRGIPVIYLSAVHDTESKVHGLALGGVDYVSKPYDGPELLARVRSHLTLRRQEEELGRYTRNSNKWSRREPSNWCMRTVWRQ